MHETGSRFWFPFLIYAFLLFLISVSCAHATGLAAGIPSCPQNVQILGGNFTLSNGWAPGSVLIYSCPLGRYPSPASLLCLSHGQWQTPRSTRLTKAVCKREAPQGCARGTLPVATWEPPFRSCSGWSLTWLDGVGEMTELLFHGALQNSGKMSISLARHWRHALMEIAGC